MNKLCAAAVLGLAATTPSLTACSSGGSDASAPASDHVSAETCASGLPGASYDVTKSRFAFGSSGTPSVQHDLDYDRYAGTDGVVAILSNGDELASLNGGAPESSLAGWSSDPSAHVEEYWEAMGVPAGQILRTDLTSGGSGGGSASGSNPMLTAIPATIGLVRGIDGIVVGESIAYAQFDVQDQTTAEGFYWPTIPADVVCAAVAFKAQLDATGGLAAYQSKLPANAQAAGTVTIHHTHSTSLDSFKAVATYDAEATSSDAESTVQSFDADGNLVALP